MISRRLLKILACPLCKSGVRLKGDMLICADRKCGQEFEITDGIPVMLPKKNMTRHHEHQREYFDREFGSYERYELENWRKSYIERIFRELDMEGSGGKGTYLDIGVGGSGYTVIEAAGRGVYSVGADLSLEGIRKARFFAQSRLKDDIDRCDFVVCAAENLPFREMSFSKVSSIAVLEHIPDDRRAISDIARVTKSGGKVWITVPNSYRKIPMIFSVPYLIHDRRIGHLRHYLAEDLIKEFSDSGLVPDKTMFSGHLEKIFQIILSKTIPSFDRSEKWRVLERLDWKNRSDRGLQLHITMDKPSE